MDAVVDENPIMSSEVTDHPVEQGENVADHARENPYVVRLSGSIVDESPEKIETLRSYVSERKLIKYIGRNIFSDVLLMNLDTKHNADNATGFNYNIQLKHVRVSRPETFEVNVKNPETKKSDAKTKTKVKSKTNVGRKQVKSK